MSIRNLFNMGIKSLKTEGYKKTILKAYRMFYRKWGVKLKVALVGRDCGMKNKHYSLNISIKNNWTHNITPSQAIQNPNISVVSFDIFDTLLERPVLDPKDMFKLMDFKGGFTTEEFVKMHTYCDLESLKRYGSKANIMDIYEIMSSTFNICKEDVAKIMESELHTEELYLRPREDMKAVFEETKCLGKTILIVSDTYYPKSFIEKILLKNGYDVDNLYVSCDLDLRKDKGDIFEHILNSRHISPETMLHIGDNLHSDYEMPKKYGISAFKINASRDTVNNSFLGSFYRYPETDNSILWGMYSNIKNRYTPGLIFNTPYDLGLWYGPLLLSFTTWLVKNIEKSNYEKLLVSYRDGYIIEKILKIIAPTLEVDEIHLSRIVRHPFYSLKKGLLSTLVELPFDEKRSVESFIKYRMYSKDEDVLSTFEIFKKIGYESETDPIENIERIYPVIDELNQIYKRNCEEHISNVKKYCKLKIPSKKFALYDVGYRGTVCAFLKEFIDIDCHEYQLFSSPGIFLNKYQDEIDTYITYAQQTRVETYIMELICENIMSIQEPELISISANANEYQYKFKEGNKETSTITEIQQGILDYVSETYALFGNKIYDLTFDRTFESTMLIRMFSSPPKEFAEIVKKLIRPDSIQINPDATEKHIKEWYNTHIH